MGLSATIASIFNTTLAAMQEVKDAQTKIIFENVNSVPPNPPAIWLSTALLPAETKPAGVGVGGWVLAEGIYQVSVYAPVNTGAGTARKFADSITEKFTTGAQFTNADGDLVTVRILDSWVSAPVSEDDWYHLPVSIRYYVYSLR